MEKQINVLVVDDTSFMRKAVSGILDADPSIQVVGTAKNGLDAVKQAGELKPDVITMDIDMPVMDGLAAIRHIMIRTPVPIVALSSLVTDGAVTFEALRLGVVDFVPKPSGAVSRDIDRTKELIVNRVKVANTVNLDNIRRVRLSTRWTARERVDSLYGYNPLEYLVVLGTTLSGPNTVIRLLSKLSPTIPAAMAVVQEVSPKIIDSFVVQFNEHVPWRVEVATDGEILEQGVCYICSNEYSMKVELNSRGLPCIRVNSRVDFPLNRLFGSAAETFHQNVIGILLTGLGKDGADGFADINRASGVTMAQKSDCCVYPNLVHNAVSQGVVDLVLDENELAGAIESVVT